MTLVDSQLATRSCMGAASKLSKKEGVNVHTSGFEFGWTGLGRGCIGEVFGGVADFQGLEPGSSPTSGTCFPCSGACGPLRVHKLFTYGPLHGPIFVGRCSGRVAPSLNNARPPPTPPNLIAQGCRDAGTWDRMGL
jgi:hypothetical protein